MEFHYNGILSSCMKVQLINLVTFYYAALTLELQVSVAKIDDEALASGLFR